MTTRANITASDKIHEQWYEEARGMTLDTLPAFLKKLTEDYGHDYGTTCHAVASAAVAAAWAVEHSPQGGITGFQAGAVMWEFIRNWDSSYKDVPLRLINYENMLFPQYHKRFNTIGAETWKWLQEKAMNNLSERGEFTHPDVIKHWESIRDGKVPFGYIVED